MADVVRDLSSEHPQAASEGTQPFNTRECAAIIGRNKKVNNVLERLPSSTPTNPFTASELRAIAENYKQTVTPADGEKVPSDSSTAKSPMPPGEFKALLEQHAQNTILEPGQPSRCDRAVPHGDLSKQGGVVDNGRQSKQACVSERGESSEQGSYVSSQVQRKGTHDTSTINKISSTTQASASTTCRQSITRATLKLDSEKLFHISTNTIGMSQKHVVHTTKEIALTQSQHDFGIALNIAKLRSAQELNSRSNKPFTLELFFDPNSESVLLINKTVTHPQQLLVIKKLPISHRQIPITLDSGKKTALKPSSYRFFVSNEFTFDITFLRRQYFALRPRPRRQASQGVKRKLDMLSQHAGPSAAKRVRVNEINGLSKENIKTQTINDASIAEKATDELNTSIIIQTRLSEELIPASISPFPSGSDLGTEYVSAVNHAFEGLQQNATIKIANATKKEDYTVIYKDNIAKQENTLVFKAEHSKIPGKLTAVKIWRSTSDIYSSGGAMFISNAIRYFLRELKNHSKVSEHSTIASLHSFDVRLLALYMEHIDAPNLAFYRDPGRNPYCTLNTSDAERVLHDIAGAVKFIHDKDVIHNDIKPANILYSKERGPVLIDFGWSAEARTVHSAGSPWYIPPEYQSVGTRGPAGDIFAFGVVMLYLMRKIPLPDLLSPRLIWKIHHLRSNGPEGVEAVEAMGKWLDIIEAALTELRSDNNPGGGGILGAVVSGIAEPRVKRRLKGHEMVQLVHTHRGVKGAETLVT